MFTGTPSTKFSCFLGHPVLNNTHVYWDTLHRRQIQMDWRIQANHKFSYSQVTFLQICENLETFRGLHFRITMVPL